MAKRIDFAGLPAEFLTFSGLFFHQAQSIDIQMLVVVPGRGAEWVKFRVSWNLMVWHFFEA